MQLFLWSFLLYNHVEQISKKSRRILMRRGGRVLIFLVLIIVILIAVVFLVLGRGILNPAQPANTTPTAQMMGIVSVGQPIKRDAEIKLEALSTMMIPENYRHEKMITNPDDVVGKYAAYPLEQGLPITTDMISDRAGINQTGSEAAKVISPGLVAVTLPLNWQSGVAFGLRDGDRVNVIATTLFVDVDANFQSILPNNFGQVVATGLQPDASTLVTLGMNNGGGIRTVGRAELDPVLNQAVYYIPSESQRPRLVSQMILQDVQVLHVGTFSLVSSAPDAAAAAPTDQAQTPVAQPPVEKPDVITLIVSPQDAVALTYLLYGGAKFTFTMRAPDDSTRVETEAATLQYILSQYAIPVPAKLPYAIQPRIDTLPNPVTIIGTQTPVP
jgi:Flp pilus assembly protein CpaB